MFSADVQTLRRRAIADLTHLHQTKKSYRSVPIVGSQSDAGCLEARSCGIVGHNHYAASHNPPYYANVEGAIDALYLRSSVIGRLGEVNARIAPFEVYVLDAWRPDAVQRYFHDTWFPAWLRRHRPQLTDAELSAEVERYWAAPSSDGSPAPHATGGAVDLTLSVSGRCVYMGGIFDDVTPNAHTDRFESLPEPLSMSDIEARSNRRLLYWAMSEAGFANNPTEWWHYSYGDQMWACLSGQSAALYGSWTG